MKGNIVYFVYLIIITILELAKYDVFFDKIMMIERKEKNKYLYLILIIPFTIVERAFCDSIIWMPITFAFYYIYIINFYKTGKVKASWIMVWYTLFLSCIDWMFVYVVKLCEQVISVQENKNIEKIISSVITFLTLCLFALVLDKVHYKGFGKINTKYFIVMGLISITNAAMTGFMTDYIWENGRIDYGKMAVYVITVIGFLAELVMVPLVAASREVYKERNELNERFLECQRRDYQKLELCEEETRRFRHDLRGHISMMKEMSELREFDTLDEYVQNLCDEFDKISG